MFSFSSGLEPILQAYEQEVIEIINEEKKEAYCAKKCAKYYRDSNVPYPRISGARFCGRGQLVCFGWTFRVMGEGLVGGGTLPKAAIKTPRALSAISGNAAAVGSSRPNSVPALIKVSDLKKSTKGMFIILCTKKIKFKSEKVSLQILCAKKKCF